MSYWNRGYHRLFLHYIGVSFWEDWKIRGLNVICGPHGALDLEVRDHGGASCFRVDGCSENTCEYPALNLTPIDNELRIWGYLPYIVLFSPLLSPTLLHTNMNANVSLQESGRSDHITQELCHLTYITSLLDTLLERLLHTIFALIFGLDGLQLPYSWRPELYSLLVSTKVRCSGYRSVTQRRSVCSGVPFQSQ